MITAGNKIIGKEKDILSIVKKDIKQMWVLINHIYERKISYKCLFEFIKTSHANSEIIFKTLYEMSNNKDDESIQSILEVE